MTIQTGYGVEARLPDGVAYQLLSKRICGLPSSKTSSTKGIDAAIERYSSKPWQASLKQRQNRPAAATMATESPCELS